MQTFCLIARSRANNVPLLVAIDRIGCPLRGLGIDQTPHPTPPSPPPPPRTGPGRSAFRTAGLPLPPTRSDPTRVGRVNDWDVAPQSSARGRPVSPARLSSVVPRNGIGPLGPRHTPMWPGKGSIESAQLVAGCCFIMYVCAFSSIL